jgi:hypothetical protein
LARAKTKKPKARSLAELLREAVDLPEATWGEARKLAKQLYGRPILPLIGAGASFDCGLSTAKPVAERMYKWYSNNNGTSRVPSDLKNDDLGLVADAIYVAGDQSKVIEALGLRDEIEWPSAKGLSEHFCSYRVLARLARESVIEEAITLNYDSCFERGLEDEGFQFEPWELHGRAWLDHATVVTDGAGHVRLDPRGQLVLTKAHGCAAAYRRIAREVYGEKVPGKAMSETLRKKLKDAEDAIVIRRGQLLDWRTDFWARDLFSDRARRHVILLIGVSGQDPVIHIALTRVLEEVYGHLASSSSEVCEEPRVVAVDPSPHTVALTSLIHEGCGRRTPGADVVTSLKVPEGTSMTAVLTAFAVEMLARRLMSETGARFENPQMGVVSTMVTVPASLRWTYFLERRRGGESLYQRANLEKVGEKGYVPLRSDSKRVAESMRVRGWLRGRLGLEADEAIDEALRGSGFVVSPRHGRAFMPLGITADELRAIPEPDLSAAAECFRAPAELEPVLVANAVGGAIGRAVRTGKIVKLP